LPSGSTLHFFGLPAHRGLRQGALTSNNVVWPLFRDRLLDRFLWTFFLKNSTLRCIQPKGFFGNHDAAVVSLSIDARALKKNASSPFIRLIAKASNQANLKSQNLDETAKLAAYLSPRLCSSS